MTVEEIAAVVADLRKLGEDAERHAYAHGYLQGALAVADGTFRPHPGITPRECEAAAYGAFAEYKARVR